MSGIVTPTCRSRNTFRNRILGGLAIAALAFPVVAETVVQTLPSRVAQALKANKIESSALSVVML